MKVLEQIDFYKIREQVASCCITSEGKELLLKREPYFRDIEIRKGDEVVETIPVETYIEHMKTCSSQWVKYISSCSNLPFSPWENVKPLISIIRTNGCSLTLEQLLQVGKFCEAVKKVSETVESKNVELGLEELFKETEKLEDLSQAESVVFRIITPDGELRDLPEIAAIRKQIASLNQKIKVIMHRYTTDQKLANVLESTVPALKNGRQVLAVKAGQQNRIKGIVHEVSNSQRTVFIEPEEAVICTNELIEKEYELQEEIKKILVLTTQELQPSIPALKHNLPVMLFLDTTYAAAKYGRDNNCVYASSASITHNDENSEPPALFKARHPLLGDKAVPIDIKFMSGKRVLIITGPNTGGKTVSLKTFALFSMMNQAGFPVPAVEGTRLPVFDKIFADIGDEQSLDQSLSTFSGHMKNIAAATRKAGERSLVLLDELGSGTDPHEGTAIAMSVLDHLIERESFVLVTTHMGILKNYGYTNPHCINASVEFNSDTLAPSYRLLMGVPGESHALDIAQRSGLPYFLCKKARTYLSTEQTDVSALIKGLTEKHAEADELTRKLEATENQFAEKFQKVTEREVEVHKREHDLKKEKSRELDDFLRESRRTLENLVRELREGELTRDKTLGVKQYIASLEKNIEKIQGDVDEEENTLADEIEKLDELKEKNKHRVSHKATKKKMKLSEALKYASAPEVSEENNLSSVKTEKKAKTVSLVSKPVFGPGATVENTKTGAKGTLVGEDKKGRWFVQFGSFKMSVPRNELKLVKGVETEPATYTPDVEIIRSQESDEMPVFELRLLGMYAEEAIRALEHQLDLCTIHNIRHFSVIHGKGNGILQQAVHDYLSHYNGVTDFRFAPPEDGGFGKTYVTLH